MTTFKNNGNKSVSVDLRDEGSGALSPSLTTNMYIWHLNCRAS